MTNPNALASQRHPKKMATDLLSDSAAVVGLRRRVQVEEREDFVAGEGLFGGGGLLVEGGGDRVAVDKTGFFL